MPESEGRGVRRALTVFAMIVAVGVPTVAVVVVTDASNTASRQAGPALSVNAVESSPAQRAHRESPPRRTVLISARATPARAIPPLHRLHVRNADVFITIDDGYGPETRVLNLIRRTHMPVTLFLLHDAVRRRAALFRSMARAGAIVEDHTDHHPFLPRLTYRQQRREICHLLPRFQTLFGRRPTLFRPPYGAYNGSTLRIAQSCHMRVVNWSVEMRRGRLTTRSGKMSAGDIILLHFGPRLYGELVKLRHIIRGKHLTIGQLETHLAPTPKPPPPRPHRVKRT